MQPLRVAIAHYHLRTGGVTRVIRHALSALASHHVQVVVLTGEPPSPNAEWPAPVQVLPALAYAERPSGESVEKLADDLEAEARRTLGAPPDVWHVHNHSLGKNSAVPLAVSALAERGRRLLLQIHDFAEDGRPADYRLLRTQVARGDAGRLGPLLYPQAGHVHYALLNSRDLAFMAAAGAARDRLHLLPNPASLELAESSPERSAERLFLYPTRAIRRKNLGEFLLWSAAAERGTRFAVTRAPKNPKARPIYDRWVRFAQELDLPVAFDVGARSRKPFPALLASANTLVTTSVAEGFGLSFLEPWLVSRPLAGRNLPEITGDFAAAGIDLTGLYDRLDVPVEGINADVLRQRVSAGLSRYFRAYARPLPPDAGDRALCALVVNGLVDFGRLDEPFQEHMIRTIRASSEARSALRPLSIEPSSERGNVVERNRRAVLERYGISQYGDRLARIYASMMQSPVEAVAGLAAGKLLDQFIAPERFSLLRAS